MWNPPFVFPVIISLGFFSFSSVVFPWMFFSTILFLSSIYLLKKSFFKDKVFSTREAIYVFLFLFSFPGVWVLLNFGQIGFVLLASLTIALCLFEKDDYFQSFLGGAVLSLTLIKPHLLLSLIHI